MEKTGRKYIILVVDDDKEGVEVVKETLEGLNYRVITAYDGEEAMARLKEVKPDLILLDQMMPKMDGLQTVQNIKKQFAEYFIPIILVTAKEDVQSKVEGLGVGADDYLPKPYAMPELIARIKSMLRIKILQDELKVANERLDKLSRIDGLTELWNHRHLHEILVTELKRAVRYQISLSFLMIDVDDFKVYNDTYGHPMGDIILKEISRILVKNLREIDIISRYGGEEFAIILPETDKENASKLALRLQKSVEEHAFDREETQPGGKMTISVGVANYPIDSRDPRSIIAEADKALYQAKRLGKNRICTLKEVELTYRHSLPYEAKNVAVAGDFNGWDKEVNPLINVTSNVWRITLNLPEGKNRYKFNVNNSVWVNDASCSKREFDNILEEVSVIEV